MKPFEFAEAFFKQQGLPLGARLHRHGSWPNGVEMNTPHLAIEAISESRDFFGRLANTCTGREHVVVDYDGTIYIKSGNAEIMALARSFADAYEAFSGERPKIKEQH